MKKIVLSIFVVAMSLATISCSKDDNNNNGDNGGDQQQLIVTIDGQQLTFDSFNVNRYNYDGGTELDITATIGGGTSRIITFYTFVGDTGSDAIFNFTYLLNGQYYTAFNGSATNFVSVTNVNNGSRLEVNFSGNLGGYDEVNQEEVIVTLESGTIRLDL
ncbi:MAG: hypothetical protein KDD05_07420 [Psychroserpens sp.]|nr:hypothetical protein [Psychroserpens sp.]